jgi:hypothetical protein
MRRLWGSGWFRLAVLALVVAAVGGGVAAAGGGNDSAPSASDRAAAERARLARLDREKARLRAAVRRDPVLRRERARLRAEQRPHFDSAAPARGTRRGQAALVTALERSITRDSRARFKAGKLDKRVLETQCAHLVRPNVLHPPPPPLTARSAGYECTAATVKFDTTVSKTGTAILGFPFWARVNSETGRYAWCKINLLPSEHGIGDSLAFVPLEPVCDVLKDGGPA